MSCEVANSPFSDPGFSNPFDSNTDHDGDDVNLSALLAFDPNNSSDVIDQDCIDPNTLSNHAGSGPPTNPFDQSLTPDFTTDIYPPDFHANQPSPYFQSIEQQQHSHQHQQQQQPFGGPFIPSALRNQHHQTHRRSVSEPPGNALMHHGQGNYLPSSSAPMIFHRDGHKLGVPRAMIAPMGKKSKQNRAQPYQQRNPRQTQTQIHSQQNPHPPQNQSRYQLRRGYTQQQQHSPIQRPPTSAPHNQPPPASFNHSPQQSQVMHQQYQHQPLHHQEPQPQPQYVSSRVCTPAPEAVDPFLCNNNKSPLPAATISHLGGNGMTPLQQQPQYQQQQRLPENLVVVKMGVDELRALITDVVQKVVGGSKGGEVERVERVGGKIDAVVGVGVDAGTDDFVAGAGTDKGVEGQQEEEGVGEEIVVAGRFDGGGGGATAAAAGDEEDEDEGNDRGEQQRLCFSPMRDE